MGYLHASKTGADEGHGFGTGELQSQLKPKKVRAPSLHLNKTSGFHGFSYRLKLRWYPLFRVAIFFLNWLVNLSEK
jgi:hypothetical protein